MTKLLEIRETIRSVYLKYDTIFRAAGKFLLALCVYSAIGSQIGYQEALRNPFLVAGLAGISAFIPAQGISFIMCGLISAGLWSIGVETGIVSVFIFILMALLYFVFKPKNSVLMAVAMLASTCNVSGILPIAFALLFGPLTLIPMSLGIVASYMVFLAKDNYSILASYSDRMTSIEKVIYYAEQLMNNERMLLMIIGFVLTFMIVYWIRKRPSSYAWSVAIPCGVTVFVMTMMTGNVVFGVAVRMAALIASCVIGVLFAVVVVIFSFVLDGTRTEYLEYEDEEYYYFVKAIPKVSVTAAEKKVKRITGKIQEQQEEDAWNEGFEEGSFEENADEESRIENSDHNNEDFPERND